MPAVHGSVIFKLELPGLNGPSSEPRSVGQSVARTDMFGWRAQLSGRATLRARLDLQAFDTDNPIYLEDRRPVNTRRTARRP